MLSLTVFCLSLQVAEACGDPGCGAEKRHARWFARYRTEDLPLHVQQHLNTLVCTDTTANFSQRNI